jgi:MoxR-like ATPase
MNNIAYGMWYVILTAGTNDKGVALVGTPGHGKSHMMKEIKLKFEPHQYRVAATTHKAALNVDGETVYSLFNINTQNHAYLKLVVDQLKSSGVTYIFIDEICMISSKVGSI